MKRRVSVKEAAKLLINTTEAAVRQRIQRSSIAHEKDEDTGRVYVVLDEADAGLDNGETDTTRVNERELIEVLKDQLEAERESNRELRRILAVISTRIPAVEAPPEARDWPVTASGDAGNGDAR